MATRSEEYVYKANEFVSQVARELQVTDTELASQATISSLHALRDLLQPEQSLHLISQLPLYIKAAFTDGWGLKKNTDKARRDPSPKEFQATLKVLSNYVSDATLHQLITELPDNLKPNS